MSIRADSYGNMTGVVAFTRHLLSGQSTFNTTTQPTGTEVEGFIDRASGHLNAVLAGNGLTTPVSNTTAVLALADWVIWRAALDAESTQQRRSFGGEEGGPYDGLAVEAGKFVAGQSLGWKRLGAAVSQKASEGLQFTGLNAQAERADPDDTDLAQPAFKRGQWDND